LSIATTTRRKWENFFSRDFCGSLHHDDVIIQRPYNMGIAVFVDNRVVNIEATYQLKSWIPVITG
jgi:hypothetical protein